MEREFIQFWFPAVLIVVDAVLCRQAWRLKMHKSCMAIAATGIATAAALLAGHANGFGGWLFVLHFAVVTAGAVSILLFFSGYRR